jgi:predicted nucleic acid-binding protein
VTIALTIVAIVGVAWLAYRVAMIIAGAIVIAELVEHGFRKRNTLKPSRFSFRRAAR